MKIVLCISSIVGGSVFLSWKLLEHGHHWMAFWLFVLVVGSLEVRTQRES